MGRKSASLRVSTAIVVLAGVLTVAIGAALPMLLMDAGSESPPDSGDKSDVLLVRRFYAAVNERLRTGDTSGLVDVVAPDLVEHPGRPGQALGRDGFLETLSALRSTFPNLRLVSRDVHSEGDEVVASVTVDGASSGSFLGLSLGANQTVWGTRDRFRIAGGMIAERWETPAVPSFFQPLAESEASVAGNKWQRGELSRRSYAANGRVDGEHAAGPVLIFCEEGTLSVIVDQPAETPVLLLHHAPAGGRSTSEPIGPDVPATLVPGDALVVPEGTVFTTVNDESDAAWVLVVMLRPEVLQGPESVKPAYRNKSDGVNFQTLAWGLATRMPSDLVVRVGQMTLGPGAEVPGHVVAGLELLIVETGTLDLATSGRAAWVRHGAGQGSKAESADALGTGDGAVVPPDGSATYRNGGQDSTSVFLVTIGPERSSDP